RTLAGQIRTWTLDRKRSTPDYSSMAHDRWRNRYRLGVQLHASTSDLSISGRSKSLSDRPNAEVAAIADRLGETETTTDSIVRYDHRDMCSWLAAAPAGLLHVRGIPGLERCCGQCFEIDRRSLAG